MRKHLDFFLFLGSTYTYLAVNRAEQVAAHGGVALRWRPFSVRSIMIEQNNRPFVGKPVKLSYMWRDLERRAQRHGIPFSSIPDYPNDPDELASRVATLAAMEGWCPQFARAAYALWFMEDKDPGDIEHLAPVIESLGKNAGTSYHARTAGKSATSTLRKRNWPGPWESSAHLRSCTGTRSFGVMIASKTLSTGACHIEQALGSNVQATVRFRRESLAASSGSSGSSRVDWLAELSGGKQPFEASRLEADARSRSDRPQADRRQRPLCDSPARLRSTRPGVVSTRGDPARAVHKSVC